MALLDSAPRVSTARASARPLSQRRIHPAISLMCGFGAIIGSALLVHLAFSVLL